MVENCTCSCSCSADNSAILILACSGASNVGQIANRAAVELTKADDFFFIRVEFSFWLAPFFIYKKVYIFGG
ncbi:putative metal-binding protein [Desulfohalotomaculum tongense]|uniref:putative zinc-binding protein n=1 Tax=Desulforadius tongensis TaxID=1216062 RepID=UPI0019574584|nr:putative zinc-binding protein [Desulforadius tongensis]MBM7854604.1 putative metal-binding protein [Desulforadius tongensis]